MGSSRIADFAALAAQGLSMASHLADGKVTLAH
jgi:hypothetical protein